MITLYQAEWCAYCHRVRQVLTELGLSYTIVNVPAANEDRAELMAIAGQDSVPVLTDGDRVYGDSDEIIEYLRTTYPAPEDADEHAALGRLARGDDGLAGAARRSRTAARAPRGEGLRHPRPDQGSQDQRPPAQGVRASFT